MRKVAICLLAAFAVSLVASISQAQCSNGACGFGGRVVPAAGGRLVYRAAGRVKARLGNTRVANTRLFDGDGRPLRNKR